MSLVTNIQDICSGYLPVQYKEKSGIYQWKLGFSKAKSSFLNSLRSCSNSYQGVHIKILMNVEQI